MPSQGEELTDAVDRGLRAVNLLRVADKQAGQYSGGMKRRLSVAISFMGNPAVVYLDEPSTVRVCPRHCHDCAASFGMVLMFVLQGTTPCLSSAPAAFKRLC